MPKHILLSLCGKTPQILTETLFCMRVQRHIPIEEIRLITTQSGREAALQQLFDPNHGHFFRFCRDYKINPALIQFDASRIIAPEDMSDILNIDDNESFANLLTAAVWELTQDADTVLHCSIAGGRKTMSAYLAMIMQFFARPQDCLYHTLVGAVEFENHPSYYYPPPVPGVITDRAGLPISTDQAGLVLIDIPFIRLRDKIPEFRQRYYTFSQMVSIAQNWIQAPQEQPQLILDSRRDDIHIGNQIVIHLTRSRFSIYRWFAEFSRLRPDSVPPQEYRSYFVRGGFQMAEQARNRLISFYPRFADINVLDFWPRLQQEISKINKHLREHLGALPQHEAYLISVEGGYGDKYYGIKLDKRCITIL